MIYTIVPILIVFGLFAATMVVENKVVANPATNVTIDVNAFQWGWKFTVPRHGRRGRRPDHPGPDDGDARGHRTSTST